MRSSVVCLIVGLFLISGLICLAPTASAFNAPEWEYGCGPQDHSVYLKFSYSGIEGGFLNQVTLWLFRAHNPSMTGEVCADSFDYDPPGPDYDTQTFTYSDGGLANGAEYYYQLEAGTGGIFDVFSVVLGPMVPSGPPSVPQNLQAEVKVTAPGNPIPFDVLLNWDAPSDKGGSYIGSYNVFKGTSPGGEVFYHRVVPTTAYEPFTYYYDLPIDESHPLVPGVTYYYKVSAVTKLDREGDAADVSVAIPRTSTPQSFSAVASGTDVILGWLAPSDTATKPIHSYKIYRGDSPGNLDCIATVDDAVTEYRDTGVTAGYGYLYRVTAFGPFGESVASNMAALTAPTPPTLDVTVDTASMYFPSQMVEFNVLFSYLGTPVDPTSCSAVLYGTSHGTGGVNLILTGHDAVGLYGFSIILPSHYQTGPSTLLVTASLDTGSGVCYGASMMDLPTGAYIDQFNAVLASIRGDIADVSTDIGDVHFDLAALDAKVVDIHGDVAMIGTNVGIIKTNVETINGVVSTIDSNVATVKTNLGTFMVDVAAIGAKVTEIKGIVAAIQTDLGVVKTDVANIRAQVTEINGRTATIKTDIGDLNMDVHWINATIMKTIGNVAHIKTTVGTIDVDMDQVDTNYIPWAVEPKTGADPAIYVGIAVLAMSLFAAGALTRGPGRCVGHSDVGKRKSRKLSMPCKLL